VQDTITLIPERLRLAGGAKLEHNSYSGVELQPSGRLVWTPNAINTIVGSVTRAVRTPSPAETDYTNASFSGMTQGLAVFVRVQPNANFVSEKLTAYELGYRLQPVTPLFVTVSSFYNQLDDILSAELKTPFLEAAPAPPHVILPIEFRNGLHGNSYGGEVTADLRATPWWRVTASYSHLRVVLSKTAGGNDIAAERQDEGSSPRHQWQLRSSFDLRGGWSADWFVRYASMLPAGPVPSYVTSNARIAWRLSPRLELAVIGTDLHRGHHLEWPGGAGGNVEVPRSAYATATWKW
jgi:iron complex outermembrane receptor protein